MGAWGEGSFENDTALDWVWDLTESTDLGVVERAISYVLDCGDYLDADAGCIGLAAAEVVAALRKRPVDGLPEEVSEWIQTRRITPSERLVKDSLAAIARIRDDDASELRELWGEDDAPPTEWYSVLDDLVRRLQ
jgi:hypothetical protein